VDRQICCHGHGFTGWISFEFSIELKPNWIKVHRRRFEIEFEKTPEFHLAMRAAKPQGVSCCLRNDAAKDKILIARFANASIAAYHSFNLGG